MELNRHAYSGSCAPDKTPYRHWTFSVGIFQWVKASTKKGIKRGKVLVRVKGLTSDPEKVYAKAREIIAALDAGAYTGPRSVTV